MTITYTQTTETEIQITEVVGNKSTSTPLKLVGSEWQKLNGEVVELPNDVIWLTDEQKRATQDALELEQRKVANSVAKLKGVNLMGVDVSLTEDNQNGIAAVMKGIELAAEMKMNIFPLNFNATTAKGTQIITFNSVTDFKVFAIEFMVARQRLFN